MASNPYNPYTQGRGWGFTGPGFGSNWYAGQGGGGRRQYRPTNPPYLSRRREPSRPTPRPYEPSQGQGYPRYTTGPQQRSPRDIGGYGTKYGYEPGQRSPGRGGGVLFDPYGGQLTPKQKTLQRREEYQLQQERQQELATLQHQAEVARFKQQPEMGYQQPEIPTEEMPTGQEIPGEGAGFQQMMTQNPWMMQMFQQFLLQNPWMQQMAGAQGGMGGPR